MFSRSFATNAVNTMNLQGDTNYLIHMSWAVFDSEESYEGGSNIVLGDKAPEDDSKPKLYTFGVLPAPPLKCTSAVYMNILASLLLFASTVSLSSIF